MVIVFTMFSFEHAFSVHSMGADLVYYNNTTRVLTSECRLEIYDCLIPDHVYNNLPPN